jgi:transposase
MLGVTRQSIYHWIAAYRRGCDLRARHDASRAGRPTLWTEELQATLRELMATSPDRLGYCAVNWTVPRLWEQLEPSTGQRLDRMGYVWKRSRYVLDPDPEREKKNGGFAGKSGVCRPAACCGPRMRRTFCCSRRCGPVGHGGAHRRGSTSAGETPDE